MNKETLKITIKATMLIGCLAATVLPARAIEGLKLSIQSSNVVLEWPSISGETYIVQYRPTLDTNVSWVTLTNSLPAAAATNRTFFVHSNVVEFCPGSGGSGAGSGGPPAPGGGESMAVSVEAAAEKIYLWDLWQYENRKPYVWEIEKRPPFPWEAQEWNSLMAPTVSMLNLINSPESLSGECFATTGFYRVVRNGIYFFGITNGTILSGRVILPIEVGFDSVLSLDSVYASAGNDPSENIAVGGLDIGEVEAAGIYATWDTSQTSNGVYQIHLGAQLGQSQLHTSPPVSIVVSNQIWFPDSFNSAGFYIEVQAQSVHANGSYLVDIFDDTDFNIISVEGTLDGEGFVTYGGIRGFLVQNFDPETFEQYPSQFYHIVVRTAAPGFGFSPASPANTATSTNFVWAETAWPSNTFQNLYTQYAVAYQPVFGNPAGGGLNAVALQSMIQAVYNAVEARPGINHAIRGGSQNPFELWTQLDYTTLLSDLDEDAVRNLFYFGHGAPDFIGQKSATPPKYLSTANFNVALNNFPRYPQFGSQPFRFVFLDGCNTAKGNLCKAFGIPKEKNMPAARFLNKGLRYRAFMGWNKNLIVGWAGAIDNQHLNFMANFLGTWPLEKPGADRPYTLREAIDVAKVSYAPARNNLVIYGYEGLWFQDTLP